jgi:hypothetical protein
MVTHQHVGIHVKAISLAVLFQSFQIVFSVRVAAKYRLALIASDNDVIKGSRKLDSRLSRHRIASYNSRAK